MAIAVGDAAELGRGIRMGLIGLGEAGCLPGAVAAVDLPGAGLVSTERAGAKPGARVPVQGVALITTDLGSIGHGHAMQHLETFPQQFCGNGTEFRPDMSRYACCWGRSHIRSHLRGPWAGPGPPEERHSWDAEGSERFIRPVLKQGLGMAGVVERAAAVGASGQWKEVLGHG